jgi:frataxin
MRRVVLASSRSFVRFATGMTDATFHSKADELIDNLMAFADYFDDVAGFEDIRFGDGVLSIDTTRGSYVINKQAPKHQIWLSSPVSGPHHYDLVTTSSGEFWASERDGHALHKLLSDEMSGILRQNVNLGPKGTTS